MKIELDATDIDKLSAEITKRVLDSLGTLKKPAGEDPVYTVETLAAYLQTTPKWVYNHIHDLPHLKIDGLLRFRKSDIDKLISVSDAAEKGRRDIVKVRHGKTVSY